MTGSSDRTPPARELAPFADAIARLIRAGGTDWSWRRARMVARDVRVGFKEEVVYELPDGSEVRPPRSLQLHQVLDPLQQRYQAHGSRAFVVTCVLTPARVESFVVDTQSDPWPGGWPDPDDLAVIAHGLVAPPPWLQARLQQLRPADRKPPTLAALWAAHAQLLLDDLGGGWEPRGKGAGLSLVRRRTPWLLDLVTLNRSRDPGTSGQAYVCVVDLLDGVDHLTLGRGISVHVPSLRSPDARRLIAGAALGPGLLLVESVQPAAEGAAALLRARVDNPDERNLLARANRYIEAAAWQLALDPATAQPYAVRAPEEVRRLIAGDTRGYAEELGAQLQDAEHLSDVARFAPSERVAAMQERAETKLAALRLDPGHRRSLPRPTLVDPMHAPLSWDELRAALEGELSVLPRDGVLTLREWRPSGVTARLSRRRDDGELELEVPDDRHLPSTRRGGAERAAALRALGWLDTDSVPGGWVCWRWPTPATARQLAAAALDTLHLVFAVERPERLGVRAVLGSASARLPMPDVPLLEYDPMTYVTQRGPRIEPERARNGRYLVTEDGDRQLVEHDEKEYLVVDDPSGVGVLPEMVFGGTLLVPAPVDAPCVQVSTVATTRTQPTTTAIVLERGGKYLLTQPPGTATQAWVHDEDVVVREYRVPSHPVRNAR